MYALAKFAMLRAKRSSDQTPDAVNWANIGPGTSPQVNANQTITGITTGITLRATLSAGAYDAGAKIFYVYKNGGLVTSVTAANAASIDCAVVSGDTVHYEATKGGTTASQWLATATVTVVETGATLDTFTISVDAP